MSTRVYPVTPTAPASSSADTMPTTKRKTSPFETSRGTERPSPKTT